MAEFLGYEFKDAALLEEALTAPAYRMDHPDAKDNQRLEFLGDAVIGFLAAERLYGEFPSDDEGSLTVKRTRMVSAAALCEAAARLNLADTLHRNRQASPLPPDSKTVADAVEAVIGAAYIDGGFDAARRVFETLQLSADDAADGAWRKNPKGELQVRAQAMTPPRRPVYEVVSVSGKAHEPVFTVKATLEGVGESVAKAHSRKAAESLAAADLLERFR